MRFPPISQPASQTNKQLKDAKLANFLVINGPNLNLIGSREPDIYGEISYGVLEQELLAWGANHGHQVTCRQSNAEHELIDWIQASSHSGTSPQDGIAINAGGFTHTSVALADALAAVAVPYIEIHVSNTLAREAFRHHSFIAGKASGIIAGFGTQGYRFALERLVYLADGTTEITKGKSA